MKINKLILSMILLRPIFVYCGWHRNTIVKVRPKIISNDIFQIDCLACDGTGEWDYFKEEIIAHTCVACKGTGKQYL